MLERMKTAAEDEPLPSDDNQADAGQSDFRPTKAQSHLSARRLREMENRITRLQDMSTELKHRTNLFFQLNKAIDDALLEKKDVHAEEASTALLLFDSINRLAKRVAVAMPDRTEISDDNRELVDDARWEAHQLLLRVARIADLVDRLKQKLQE